MDERLSDYVMNLTQQALKPENVVSGRCFLCGGPPTKGKSEHVFPRWLQRRFYLWDQTLTLLNGTRISYRDIRIPACEDCNSRVLGKTETYVSALQGSDVSDWSQHLGKIQTALLGSIAPVMTMCFKFGSVTVANSLGVNYEIRS